VSLRYSQPRDFFGYGGNPPHVRWPNDAKVAVCVVINVEEGAEYMVSGGDARNEGIYEVVEQIAGHPDPCIESHFEYGTRSGYWRIMAVLDRFMVKATLSACGRAVEVSPWLARDAMARGHEIAAHGYRWEPHWGLTEEDVPYFVDVAGCMHLVVPYSFDTNDMHFHHTQRFITGDDFATYVNDTFDALAREGETRPKDDVYRSALTHHRQARTHWWS
jgi:hypothetical protein